MRLRGHFLGQTCMRKTILERMKERERKEMSNCELVAGEPEDDDMQANSGG